ncbi:hypothetical protein CDAR_386111 [Caerostris darwini]|uniref:Uncharacterized protein n=1 Tax=Caerostris darwini TaxID=1538125 RepID=A0AAV4SL54_9ARAC|nr:hypothetical protein CDAR_386111 [Caerostris darwini]
MLLSPSPLVPRRTGRKRRCAMKNNDCLSIHGVPLAGEGEGMESIKSDPISGWPNSSCCVRKIWAVISPCFLEVTASDEQLTVALEV